MAALLPRLALAAQNDSQDGSCGKSGDEKFPAGKEVLSGTRAERRKNRRRAQQRPCARYGSRPAAHRQPRRINSATPGIWIAFTSCPSGVLNTRPFP